MSARIEREATEDYFNNDPGPSLRHASSFSGRSQSPEEESAVKKRKVSRACDVCRKRKVRCDFVQLPSGNLQKCLNCFSNKIECTFTEDNKPRRTSKNYVQSLEQKVERTEKLIELLCPDARLREEMLEGDSEGIPPGVVSPISAQQLSESEQDPPIDIQAIAKAVGSTPLDLMVMVSRLSMYRRYPPEHGRPNLDEQQEDEDDISEADHLSHITQEQLRIKEETPETDHFVKPFYFGKSSARAILAQVIKVKNESRSGRSASVSTTSSGKGAETDSDAASGLDARMSPTGPGDGSGESPWVKGVLDMTDDSGYCNPGDFMDQLRPEYWRILPWEKKAFRMGESQRNTNQFSFPEPALFQTLADNYFKYINIELPLLHRPTFEREIANGLHRRDAAFGATVLLVCALGSRYSEDPRVQVSEAEAHNASEEERVFMAGLRAAGENRSRTAGTSAECQSRTGRPASTYHARGWKFFDQAWKAMNNLLIYSPPTLYDLQFYSLATEYLRGTSLPQASWVMVGIGIRLGQDIGAHRKRIREPCLEPELAKQDELRKRAFWVLVSLDRLLSSATGRPCAIQDECFDLDDPIECDDEYWDTSDPAMLFKQPEGKPSLMTAFVLLIRLNQILATCLRTIYSTKKGHAIRGLLRLPWRDKVVSEMDSVLNKWMDLVPPHLRWNVEQPNDEFFMQSANLHAAYYYMRILVHRPFIPSPSNPTPTVEFPSLAICTHAARSLIHIGLAQLERLGEVSSTMPLQLLGASVVLLLRMWEDRRTGNLTEQMFKADMDDLNSCLKILDTAEKRWFSAGKLRDLLHSLIPENGMYGTVAAEFSKKVQQRLNSHANAKAPGTQLPPLSAPSPFAPSPGNMADGFQQSPPPFHAGSSDPGVSPPSSASASQSSVFASPSSRPNVASGGSYRHAAATPAHLSRTGAAPSADPNAQWSMFASSSGPETPQQHMFADPRRGGNLWVEPSGFYQPQPNPQQGHQRQSSSFDQAFAAQSGAPTAPLDANMFSLSGLDDFTASNDFGLGTGSFVPAPSPYWPGATVLGPNPTAGDMSASTSPSMYDDWNYLSGLVDLTSRNELLDQLFPHHPQPGYSSGPSM